MVTLTVNGKKMPVDADPDTPLLWVLRDHLNMTGTKYGCGMALCGACTVHINGQPTRSCVTQISTVAGKNVTTAGEVREAIDAARTDNKNSVLMRVKSGGSSRFVAVPLAKG